MWMIANGTPMEFRLVVEAQEQVVQGKCHLDVLRSLLRLADDALLVAPFLYPDFAPLLGNLRPKPKRLELITTCARKGAEELDKPNALRSFGQAAQALTGSWPEIAIDEKLHSKIYAFFRGGVPIAAVVTSANLTTSGLELQHETGVLITEPELISALAASARQRLDYVSLSEHAVDQLCTWVDVAGKGKARPPAVDIGLGEQLRKHCAPSAQRQDLGRQDFDRFFIKVSGDSDRHILPEQRQSWYEPYGKVTFANYPTELKVGDCLLEVAVGGKCFLSYYSSASTIAEFDKAEQHADPDRKRWPFYVWANNLSPHYATHWFERPLYYDDVVADFLKAHPDVPVVPSGKFHIKGAIQYHHSYFKVTPEFGRFAMQQIRQWSWGKGVGLN